MKLDINQEIEIPEGVEVKIDNNFITAKGPKGEVKRRLQSRDIKIKVEGNKVLLNVEKATKREKRLAGTFYAHINNMVHGAKEGYTYKLKICSSHFPISSELKDNVLLIKNYLGETVPRKVNIMQGADVKIDGEIISIESADKEIAGTIASAIEEACKIRNRDRRIFQDGIFITEKAGKEIEQN